LKILTDKNGLTVSERSSNSPATPRSSLVSSSYNGLIFWSVRLDDYRSSNKVCETRSWSPVSSKKPYWLPSLPTCQVPMLPSECTHSSGTGGWYQCHSPSLSSSTTRPESTSSETTPQATGSRRRPTTKEHARSHSKHTPHNKHSVHTARSSSSRTTLVPA